MMRRLKLVADDEGQDMEALRMIWKRLSEFWTTRPDTPFMVDTHRWENKMETLRLLSSGSR